MACRNIQASVVRAPVQVGNSVLAGIERHHTRPSLGRSDGQVPESATEVEDPALEIRQCEHLKGVERVFAARDLALELVAEELD